MKKAKTRIIWGIVIAVIAVIIIARMFKKDEPVVHTPDPVVSVETPHMGDILLNTDLVGTIEPADIVYIYPKAGRCDSSQRKGRRYRSGRTGDPGDRYQAGGCFQDIDGGS